MLKLKRKGLSTTEVVFVFISTLIALVVVLKYFLGEQGLLKNIFESNSALDGEERYLDAKTVKELKEQATLVIVGKLLNIEAQDLRQETEVSYGAFNLEVMSVERGYYHYNTIKFYVGIYSPDAPLTKYRRSVKTNYRPNDYLRVFLNYDPQKNIYYTPAAYYTIESVD
jgi:hypothetical protein